MFWRAGFLKEPRIVFSYISLYMLHSRYAKKPDYVIIFCLAALIIFGLVMLASASSNQGQLRFGDSYFYLKHQILYGLLPGLAGFFVAIFVDYRKYQKIALFFGIFSILLLFLVFTPLGFEAGGADRWLKLGAVTFQSSEVVKLTFILYLAAWLGNNRERVRNFTKGFLPFLVISGIIGLLLLKQPSTSTAVMLMATALIIYFVSGAKLSYIVGFILLGALVLAAVIYLTPYRWNRITNFLQPDADPQAGGYHINQALIAIGSGGWFGVGYGQSTTKISYLPEAIGDSIFAVIAEEFGFVGSASLALVFLILVLKILFFAKKTPDRFGKLLLIGFAVLIGLQASVNIAAISGLIPLTGMPLPFISYGGTALAVFMTMGGIVVNISKGSR